MIKLLADKPGEQFLIVLEENDNKVLVQFISNEGIEKGKHFLDEYRSLFMNGWKERFTSTAIGLYRFKKWHTEDLHVSFALHQLYPLGRKIKLPNNQIAKISSYANTHSDGYYMYLKKENESALTRLKVSIEWKLLK